MTITLDGTLGISTPMYAGSITSNPVTPSVSMKNRIINGAMVIDQRNVGASVTANAEYPVDRFQYQNDSEATVTWQQSATAPIGFANSLSATISTADASVGASQYSMITQRIEGYNIADLNWGTANAKTITLSFWVRASVTGTFGGVINNDGSSRSYPFTYTISSANTFEYKTVTIDGDTSGTWLKTNGAGFQVRWVLGVGSSLAGSAGSWSGSTFFGATGSTNLISTLNATFYITGCQLEVGSTASSFDYRPYGTELVLCQRYFEKSYNISVVPATNSALGAVTLFISSLSTGYMAGSRSFAVSKRDAPTVTIYSVSGTSGTVADGNTINYAVGNANQIGTSAFSLQNTSGSTYTPTGNLIYFQYIATSEI